MKICLLKSVGESKAEKKWVFIDCYTSWCGPCKTMLNNVFPVKEVGDILNTRCVNIKFDMEVGEGKILAEKYGVKSFPTFLIFNRTEAYNIELSEGRR